MAAAGPSLLEPGLPGGRGRPPLTLNLHPNPDLAVALTAGGIGLGAAGLILTLRAVHAGWAVRPGPILLAGALAVTVLSQTGPFGSSDFLSYAAYGRELITGHNPYIVTPAVFARAGDPVARAVQDWRGTASVYGPLANEVFGLASLAGGTSARLTVWLLDVINSAAFIATGLLLDRLACLDRLARRRPEPEARAARLRAALLWTGNPLLLQVLVAGGHVDSLAVCFAVAGLAVGSRPGRASALAGHGWLRALAAGALLGCGFAVKPTVALVGAGMAASLLVAGRPVSRWLSRLWAAAAGFAAVAGAGLLLMGRAGVADSMRASRMVSVGSPWRPVRSALSLALPESVADDLVRWGAIVLMMLLVLLWLNATRPSSYREGRQRAIQHQTNAVDVPSTVIEGGRCDIQPLRKVGDVPSSLVGGGPVGWGPVGWSRVGWSPVGWGRMGAGVALGVVAWLVAWPYVLPWYGALGWALLPLADEGAGASAGPGAAAPWGVPAPLGAGALQGVMLGERVMIGWTAMLGVAYLPARSAGVVIPAGLRWMEPVVRSAVCPAVLAALALYLAFSLVRGAWAPAGHSA